MAQCAGRYRGSAQDRVRSDGRARRRGGSPRYRGGGTEENHRSEYSPAESEQDSHASAIDGHQRLQSMVITPPKIPDIDRAANQGISNTTSVPWIIAVIHEREKGNDRQFLANIAQGDPWNRQSVSVPKGRGPFGSFEEAAIDALAKCAPFAARGQPAGR